MMNVSPFITDVKQEGNRVTYVYLAEGPDGEHKIGRSYNPEQRVRSFKGFNLITKLDTGTFKKSVETEHFILQRLKQWCVRGNEWFRFPKTISAHKTFHKLANQCSQEHSEHEIVYRGHYVNILAEIATKVHNGKHVPLYRLNTLNKYKDTLQTEYNYPNEYFSEQVTAAGIEQFLRTQYLIIEEKGNKLSAARRNLQDITGMPYTTQAFHITCPELAAKVYPILMSVGITSGQLKKKNLLNPYNEDEYNQYLLNSLSHSYIF